ncbi:MAG TPA: hypothetical protein VMF30_19225, partial [Pirellulales bacterium]|nr:hypothetical protein [Pirellulales bacterium]
RRQPNNVPRLERQVIPRGTPAPRRHPRESNIPLMRFQPFLAELVAFSRSPRARRWLGIAGMLVPFAVGALLVYQLSAIGWREMLRSIPTSPAFYLLFLVQYLTLPVFDAAIFARCWRAPFWRLLIPASLKQVYNRDVVELSGEAYFFVWSTRRLAKDPGVALRTIKDVSVLSAVAGYVMTLGLPPVCLWLGMLGPQAGLSRHDAMLIGWGAPLLLAALIAAVLAIWRKIFFLSGKSLCEVTGLHLTRFAIMNAVTVAQWMVVMPDQPARNWWTLLAVSNMIGRLPSLLCNNLIFVAAGIEMSAGLALPVAGVAGMLLTNTALDKLLNLGMFLSTWIAGRLRPPSQQLAVGMPPLPPDDTARSSTSDQSHRAA